MQKVLQFIGFVIMAGILYLVWISVPVARDMLACYDIGIAQFDDIELKTRTQGWSVLSRCKIKKERIISLGECLDKAQNERAVPPQILQLIDSSIPLIRPGNGSMAVIKATHDSECTDYPDTMFSPPQ